MTNEGPAVPNSVPDHAGNEAVGNAASHGECTCLAYPTPGSPGAFDDWTVDQDPYCPRHGQESYDDNSL